MRTRSSGARRGTSACWRSGAGERACWTRHRRDCPRRAGSNSTIGRPRPPPCGEALGEPHRQALALLGSQHPEDLREAIEILDRLGAVAAVPLARARLRALGVATVPRGRARSTRANPGGLTDRQLEVLRLVEAGMSNGEIAGRLVLSPKTVEHHVGAVLAKLGVSSRAEAAAAARGLGVVGRRPGAPGTQM